MYNDIDRYDKIDEMSFYGIQDATDLKQRLKDEGQEVSLNDVLTEYLINTLDDGGESIHTTLVEIRDALYAINETLTLLQ